jgi:hypothetical protein
MAVQRCWFMSASLSPTMLAPFLWEPWPETAADETEAATADIFFDLLRPLLLIGSLIFSHSRSSF